MFRPIQAYCTTLTQQFDRISAPRQSLLMALSDYIAAQQTSNLLFICTHNSRRSHFGQIWAAVAAHFFGLKTVHTFSGGTETTCFHHNAIASLIAIGFDISATTQTSNPLYNVKFGEAQHMTCFSKRYDDEVNPHKDFAAIMTCSQAEQDCPVIFGADKRFSIGYDDPKAFDQTPMAQEAYRARCEQIALEMLFVFAQQRS